MFVIIIVYSTTLFHIATLVTFRLLLISWFYGNCNFENDFFSALALGCYDFYTQYSTCSQITWANKILTLWYTYMYEIVASINFLRMYTPPMFYHRVAENFYGRELWISFKLEDWIIILKNHVDNSSWLSNTVNSFIDNKQ